MFRDSFSRPAADTRHDARVLVSQTAEHRERLEALATLAEGDVGRAEREVADATAVSAALRSVLAANLLGALQRCQTSTELCIGARHQHRAALRLLDDLDEDSCEKDRNADRPHAVLVVDDSADVRELIAHVLQSAGFLVRTAGNGLEGLIAACDMRPNVIVMDVTMPVLNGIEATRLIKAHDATRSARVIAYTGDPAVDRLRATLFVAVLQKPATPDAVLAAVRHAVTL
jgi:CheY-like chemotaxis protein